MIIVYDYETVNPDIDGPANVETSELIQIAAVPLDENKLVLLEDEVFNIRVKPDSINAKNKNEFINDFSSVLDFHCKASKKSVDEFVEIILQGMPQKEAFKQFLDYIKEFRKDTICSGGQNIKNFDNPITKRLCAKYEKRYPFSLRDYVDTTDIFSWYFRYAKNKPKNLKMDTVLDHLHIDRTGSHDALTDVLNCGRLMLRFLKLQKSLMNRDEQWVHFLNGNKII